MCVARKKKENRGGGTHSCAQYSAVSTEQQQCEGVVTTKAKSVGVKRSTTQVSGQNIGKNFDTFTGLGYPIDYMQVDEYSALP